MESGSAVRIYTAMAATKTDARFVTATVAVSATTNLDIGDIDTCSVDTVAGVALARVEKGPKSKQRGNGIRTKRRLEPNVTLQVGGVAAVKNLNIIPDSAKRMRACETTNRSGFASTFSPVGLGTAISTNRVLMHPTFGPALPKIAELDIKAHLNTLYSGVCNQYGGKSSQKALVRIGGVVNANPMQNLSGTAKRSHDYLQYVQPDGLQRTGLYYTADRLNSRNANEAAVTCWSFMQTPFDKGEALKLEAASTNEYGLYWPDSLTTALKSYSDACVAAGNAAPAIVINHQFVARTAARNAGRCTGPSIANGTADTVMWPTANELKDGTYNSVIAVANVDELVRVNAALVGAGNPPPTGIGGMESRCCAQWRSCSTGRIRGFCGWCWRFIG